jgi:thioredoxin-related protein
MRILWITLLSGFLISSTTWETDFEKAKQLAQSEHKLILLNFSGSDWCGPCIRMHDEIFESNIFSKYANINLVLVNADFPRLKKHELSKDQQKKNDELADLYNKDGIFPMTLLLTPEGKILKIWEGFTMASPDTFTNQVKTIADASK